MNVFQHHRDGYEKQKPVHRAAQEFAKRVVRGRQSDCITFCNRHPKLSSHGVVDMAAMDFRTSTMDC